MPPLRWIEVRASSRMFEPPGPDLDRINARLQSLPPPLRGLVQRAGDALAVGDARAAQSALAGALAQAPEQPDALRMHGLLLAQVGNLRAAVANFEAAIRAAPDDAMGYWQYAQVLEDSGEVMAALRLREQAAQRLPESPMALADLGEHLVRHGHPEEAMPLLERATQLAPGHAPAQLRLGDALVACGRIAEGAAAIRRALAVEPAFATAWLGLADLKTVSISDSETAQLRGLLRSDHLGPDERTALGFVLAKACEDRHLHGEAFALLLEANARRRSEVGPWDEREFQARIERGREVFSVPRPHADNPTLGDAAIFIVGLPRSGSTLVEQVLASHPDVQGLGELGELAQVLTEESARRQQRYPGWVPEATAQDWQRLGSRYLELVARRRDGHPRFTDKMPNNWQALGALCAMLPGARVVVCRRDPLENCWSCFRQYFTSGWQFTCDLGDLGAFWKAFDRTAAEWTAREPARVRAQGYEALAADPREEITELLAFCGLRFDPACLAPHRLLRPVDTLSADQVRKPIHRPVAVAAAYGKLMDPLRSALGLPVFASTS